MAAKPVVLKLL